MENLGKLRDAVKILEAIREFSGIKDRGLRTIDLHYLNICSLAPILENLVGQGFLIKYNAGIYEARYKIHHQGRTFLEHLSRLNQAVSLASRQ